MLYKTILELLDIGVTISVKIQNKKLYLAK